MACMQGKHDEAVKKLVAEGRFGLFEKNLKNQSQRLRELIIEAETTTFFPTYSQRFGKNEHVKDIFLSLPISSPAKMFGRMLYLAKHFPGLLSAIRSDRCPGLMAIADLCEIDLEASGEVLELFAKRAYRSLRDLRDRGMTPMAILAGELIKELPYK